jgi:predicted dehydrogenase
MGEIRARSAKTVEGVEICSVYDANRDNLPKPLAAQSAQEIIDNPDIDAVFVCLPNHLNKSTTIAALKAGKHVFCEKPPAFSAKDVEEIMEAERASGRVLMYGFNHRHHAAVVTMKQAIDSGNYGRVLWMRGRYGKSVDADYLNTWRAKKEFAGGGILIDQGIHMLDLFLHLSGSTFDEVHAMVSSRYWNMPGIEDNVFALMRNNDSGLEVSFHSTMTQWRHLFSLEVFLEGGYLVLNGLKTSSGTYGAEELSIATNRSVAPAATWESEVRQQFDTDISWDSEAAHFFGAIRGEGRVEYGTSAQALAVMHLVDEIYSRDRRVSNVLYDKLSAAE